MAIKIPNNKARFISSKYTIIKFAKIHFFLEIGANLYFFVFTVY